MTAGDLQRCAIDVATVSPERRGATVNWLVARLGVPIHNGMSDELIEMIWQERSAKETRAAAVMVRIEEVGRS